MRKDFPLAILVFLFCAAIVFPYLRYYADNPDTFQYIDIAYKYLSGDFKHAVNSYWSPMICWLLVIPLSIFSNELLAFKILQVIVGLFVVYQWYQLLNKVTFTTENTSFNFQRIKIIMLFFSIPFIIDYALLNLTPDLLYMGLTIFLLNQILKGDFIKNRKATIVYGLTGASLFLTKAFGLPFFIAISVLVIFLSNERREIFRRFKETVLPILICFAVPCIIWILIISSHEGKFTISESARFNMSRDIAPLPERPNGLPILGVGLHKPSENSSSAWETPGEYVSGETISLFSSPGEYLKIVKRNLLTIYYYDFRNQVGIIFLVLLILLIIKNREVIRKEKWFAISLVFILMIYFGYSLILVHTRYIWINSILMTFLSVFITKELFKKSKYRFIPVLLTAFVILLSLKRPLKEIFYTEDKDIPARWIFLTIKNPFETLSLFYRPDYELQKTIEDLRGKKILNGNFASLKNEMSDRDSYTSSLRLTRAMRGKYFGQLSDENEDVLLENFVKMKIDYVIVYSSSHWGQNPVYSNNYSGIKIFRVEDQPKR